MKKTKILFVATLIVAVTLITGCTALDKLYSPTQVYVPAVTNQFTELVTNSIPAATNVATGVVTPAHIEVTPEVKLVVTPAHYTTQLVDAPAATGTIELIKSIPVPGFGLAGGVLSLVYSIYRNIRNKKALVAVVQGIDDARKLLQTTPELQKIDAQVKDFLIKHQEVSGTLNEVSKIVNTYTDDTVKTP